jgi:hypothetical protein
LIASWMTTTSTGAWGATRCDGSGCRSGRPRHRPLDLRRHARRPDRRRDLGTRQRPPRWRDPQRSPRPLQPQQKSPRDRPRPHRAGRSRTPRPHQPLRRARTTRRDLATTSRLNAGTGNTRGAYARPAATATREWVASLARPRSQPTTTPRAPQPRPRRAINSKSEAVSTRDARRPRPRPAPSSLPRWTSRPLHEHEMPVWPRRWLTAITGTSPLKPVLVLRAARKPQACGSQLVPRSSGTGSSRPPCAAARASETMRSSSRCATACASASLAAIPDLGSPPFEAIQTLHAQSPLSSGETFHPRASPTSTSPTFHGTHATASAIPRRRTAQAATVNRIRTEREGLSIYPPDPRVLTERPDCPVYPPGHRSLDRFRRTRLPRPSQHRQLRRRLHVHDGHRQQRRDVYTDE